MTIPMNFKNNLLPGPQPHVNDKEMVPGVFIGRRPERACMRYGPASELKITNLSTLRYIGIFLISKVLSNLNLELWENTTGQIVSKED